MPREGDDLTGSQRAVGQGQYVRLTRSGYEQQHSTGLLPLRPGLKALTKQSGVGGALGD